jgi:hypothetical protein
VAIQTRSGSKRMLSAVMTGLSTKLICFVTRGFYKHCAIQRWCNGIGKAQRLAHQPRRPDRLGMSSHHDSTEHRGDLARRNGVGWMRWLGGTTPTARDNLPAGLAPEGAAWHDARRRSFSALVAATAVGCVPCDGARGRSLRFRSHAYGRWMRCLGWRARAFPAMTYPGNACVPRDGARMPDSRALAIRLQQSRG